MNAQGLVVESRFQSRKEIVRNLKESQVVVEVIEARSVRDGLSHLERQTFATCFLGPSLSDTVVVDFVKKGRELSKASECAFIAVLGKDPKKREMLSNAGLDGVLEYPFGEKTFSHTVERAISEAKLRAARGPVGELREQLSALSIGQKGLVDVREKSLVTFSQLLRASSEELRGVARALSLGRLQMRANGRPTLATQDAIRLALERAFPEELQVWRIGSENQKFITALVEWFSDRIQYSSEEATDRLRESLLQAKNV